MMVFIYMYVLLEQVGAFHLRLSRASTVIFEERLLALGRVGDLQLPPISSRIIVHLVELFRPRVETLAIDLATAVVIVAVVAITSSC